MGRKPLSASAAEPRVALPVALPVAPPAKPPVAAIELAPGRGQPGATPPVGLRDFSRSLPMLLLRSHQAVMAEFRPILRSHGITEQQWRVLRALTTAESVRIAQVAALTLISGPSLTRIRKGLEERGLLARRAEPQDQRASRISLTASARQLIAQVAPQSEQRYRSIADRLGEHDIDALYQLLGTLPDRLGGPGARRQWRSAGQPRGWWRACSCLRRSRATCV